MSRRNADKWPRGCLGKTRKLVDKRRCSVAAHFVSKSIVCHDVFYLLFWTAVGVRVVLQYYPVMEAGAKAKTVTNNLPLLSVLGVRRVNTLIDQ